MKMATLQSVQKFMTELDNHFFVPLCFVAISHFSECASLN